MWLDFSGLRSVRGEPGGVGTRASAFFGWALLVSLLGCQARSASGSAGSGATNWLKCVSDVDCTQVADATCGDEGVCVDREGRRIKLGAALEGGAADPESGAPLEANDASPSAEQTAVTASTAPAAPVADDKLDASRAEPTSDPLSAPAADDSSVDAGTGQQPSDADVAPTGDAALASGECRDKTECAADEICRGPYEPDCGDEECAPSGCAVPASAPSCSSDTDCTGQGSRSQCSRGCRVCVEPCTSNADCSRLMPGRDSVCAEDGSCTSKSCDQVACSPNFQCVQVNTTDIEGRAYYECQPLTCETDANCAQGVCVAWSGADRRYCADVAGRCEPDPSAAACDVDACRPEVCDEPGERCCDPFPGDGMNYCNAGLACDGATCQASAAAAQCGDSVCASGETCCDPCQDACISVLAGAACPDAALDKAECPLDRRSFTCGETQCSAVAAQYCEVFAAGPAPETAYTCRDLPEACLADRTCDCLEGAQQFVGASCAIGSNTELVFTLPPAP